MSMSPEEEAGRQVPTNKLKAGEEDIAGSDSSNNITLTWMRAQS